MAFPACVFMRIANYRTTGEGLVFRTEDFRLYYAMFLGSI